MNTQVEPGERTLDVVLPRGRLLLVVAGSFAATSATNWITTFRRLTDWEIRTMVTYMGSRLVAPSALAAASRNPVAGPEWPIERGMVPHQDLGQWADLIIVVGATANFMAKCAACMPDTLALSTVISSFAPVVLAPALPDRVLDRPSYRRVVAQLEEDGYELAGPVPSYALYSGQESRGGMAPLSAVLEACVRALSRSGRQGAATPLVACDA